MSILLYLEIGAWLALTVVVIKHIVHPSTRLTEYTWVPVTVLVLWPIVLGWIFWAAWHDRQELIDLWKNRP